jgi:hypothetical protein
MDAGVKPGRFAAMAKRISRLRRAAGKRFVFPKIHFNLARVALVTGWVVFLLFANFRMGVSGCGNAAGWGGFPLPFVTWPEDYSWPFDNNEYHLWAIPVDLMYAAGSIALLCLVPLASGAARKKGHDFVKKG